MWYVVIFIAVLLVDQVTKILCAFFANGVEGTSVLKVIDGFLEITYVENTDGMMGLFDNLKGREFIFIISTCLILVGLFLYLGLSKNRSKWRNFTMTFILAGAFGNFIDRIVNFSRGSYVRDMIHTIIKFGGREYFPYIFNVADISLVVGAIMLILDLLFIDKDAVFKFKKKEEKTAESSGEN